jgi:hypothetical protein
MVGHNCGGVAEVLAPPPPLQLQLKCHLCPDHCNCGGGTSATIAVVGGACTSAAIVAEAPLPHLWLRWHFSCSCSGGGGDSTSATIVVVT